MRAFSFVLCLTALAWGASAYTLKETLLELLASEVAISDVATVDDSSLEDGQCKCCDHGCFCSARSGLITASARIAIDEIHRKSCCPNQVVATFMVGTDIFEDTFPVNEDKTICSDDKKYCFLVDVKDPDKRGQKFMHGYVEMTRPRKMTLGAFNLPLATVTHDSVPETDTSNLIF